MPLFNKEKFSEYENTRFKSYLEEVFSVVETEILNDLKQKCEKDGLTEEETNRELSLQVLATLFFQFEEQDVPKELIELGLAAYLSYERNPFEVMKNYFFIHNGERVNGEKEVLLLKRLYEHYETFYEKYDETNDSNVINNIMGSLNQAVISIKEFKEEIEEQNIPEE